MATGIKAAQANSILDTLFGTSFIKLHVGDPGAAGTANPAANTTRKSVTWASASGGSKASGADLLWSSVPNTETYTHWSAWDDVTAGNFEASGTVSGGAVTASNDFKVASGGLTFGLTVAA